MVKQMHPPDHRVGPSPPGDIIVLPMRIWLAVPLVLLAGNARAETYHVAPGGAIASIQAAVDRAGPGDTIVVHAGTYRESVQVRNSGTAKQPLVIAAAPGE